MMSQLAKAVLFQLLLKIPNKKFVYQILCVHLCPGSIIQFPSKHLKFWTIEEQMFQCFWLFFPISSKGSFICIIPQTG